ncbi:MAG: SDR family NAD(P)-dependent oxidoreductase [Leptolyngbya sp. PLA3]|nr:MAG: SDR family NAD(P)-dependent oxidoreductase [Cyanobacteria bacterium CYA]MCE7967807.1 SDR family NAD(P)-dependent oxidoreductase [Leptolyngbya sp. PL-A3]
MKLPGDQVVRFRSALQGASVCVTGGAGFIGGHLVDALVSVGARVTVIDDLSNSSAEHLADLIDLEPDRVRFVHGSILDQHALADAIDDGTSIVFHLAAIGSVPRSLEQPARTWDVNATGVLRVLERARNVNARRVVFSASSSVYGDAVELPKIEDMPASPTSPYGASKAAAEALVTSWARSFGLSTVNLRYFNIFGPRQPADSAYAGVVAAFGKALLAGQSPIIYGDGSQTRDFTYVSNAVLANLLAATSPRPLAGEIANIGTGRRVSVNELAEAMARALGCPHIQPEYRPARAGDVLHSQADISRARDLLDFEPIQSLEEGLLETVEWFRAAFSAGGSNA